MTVNTKTREIIRPKRRKEFCIDFAALATELRSFAMAPVLPFTSVSSREARSVMPCRLVSPAEISSLSFCHCLLSPSRKRVCSRRSAFASVRRVRTPALSPGWAAASCS